MRDEDLIVNTKVGLVVRGNNDNNNRHDLPISSIIVIYHYYYYYDYDYNLPLVSLVHLMRMQCLHMAICP